MSVELVYSVGTIGWWAGLIAAIRALLLGLKIGFRAIDGDPARTRRGFVMACVVAAIGFLVAGVTPMELGHELPGGKWETPLVWVYMNAWGWGMVAGVVFAGLRFVQAFLALTDREGQERRKAALMWLGFALVCGLFFGRTGGEAVVFRGAIPLRPSIALALLFLAVLAMVAMVAAARFTKGRGWSKVIATHTALVAGSVIFGLPFAWLVITSFKEDRDMASPDGIVWVPRVQVEVPYLDPIDPLLVTEYEGRRVETSIIEENPDGTLTLDIVKPASLRGLTVTRRREDLEEIPKLIPLVSQVRDGREITGKVIQEMPDGSRRVEILEPESMAGEVFVANPGDLEPVRRIGLRWRNYSDALEFLPPETYMGLVYLKNTLLIVILSVLGTLASSSIVAYAFSRLRFPGRNVLFMVLLSTMMLPAAVTLLPTFLIFRALGMIDTLYPIWIPAFFASAFNVFLLRQFFLTIPMELEDAAKIDGCSYLRTFWQVMLPQVKPALAVIAIWTFMGAWNNFMGPLIYVNSPEQMPISYALQLFQGDRGGEPGLLMAVATLSMLPVLALFFFAQRYFIEGVTLSGLGGK